MTLRRLSMLLKLTRPKMSWKTPNDVIKEGKEKKMEKYREPDIEGPI